VLYPIELQIRDIYLGNAPALVEKPNPSSLTAILQPSARAKMFEKKSLHSTRKSRFLALR
jgi:hypothetical protein